MGDDRTQVASSWAEENKRKFAELVETMDERHFPISGSSLPGVPPPDAEETFAARITIPKQRPTEHPARLQFWFGCDCEQCKQAEAQIKRLVKEAMREYVEEESGG